MRKLQNDDGLNDEDNFSTQFTPLYLHMNAQNLLFFFLVRRGEYLRIPLVWGYMKLAPIKTFADVLSQAMFENVHVQHLSGSLVRANTSSASLLYWIVRIYQSSCIQDVEKVPDPLNILKSNHFWEKCVIQKL